MSNRCKAVTTGLHCELPRLHCKPTRLHCEPSSLHCKPARLHCEPPRPQGESPWSILSLHNSLISTLMRTHFYFVADPYLTFPKTKMVNRYCSIAVILWTVFAKCLSSYHCRTVAKFENILDYGDEIARDVSRRLCQCLLYIFHRLLILETSPVSGL